MLSLTVVGKKYITSLILKILDNILKESFCLLIFLISIFVPNKVQAKFILKSNKFTNDISIAFLYIFIFYI